MRLDPHQPAPPLEGGDHGHAGWMVAYRKGWAASKRTSDLDSAEDRYIRRHGAVFHDAFVRGWTDRVVGSPPL